MLNPMRDKNEGTNRGGEGLVQKIVEGKTSYSYELKLESESNLYHDEYISVYEVVLSAGATRGSRYIAWN